MRIVKNPLLCFVDTIDWTAIAYNTDAKDHYITNNRPANECPQCPAGKKADSNDIIDQDDENECPVSPSDNKKRLCWNRKYCQKGNKFYSNLMFY